MKKEKLNRDKTLRVPLTLEESNMVKDVAVRSGVTKAALVRALVKKESKRLDRMDK